MKSYVPNNSQEPHKRHMIRRYKNLKAFKVVALFFRNNLSETVFYPMDFKVSSYIAQILKFYVVNPD